MLELRNVSFFAEDGRKQKEILRDINLTVEDHQFMVITGPNGGGKSTLARLITGIAKPTSGSIWMDGKDITHWDITERAQAGIGYAFQQPVRFKGLSVLDMLSIAAGRDLNVEEGCKYLSEVGLCAMDYVERELNASLSGGELKRIEIAMLIARGTKFSVFDEPEAGIDLWSFHNLIRVFEHLRRVTNGTVMIISHQERILEIADRVVVLADGRITAQGPKEEVLPALLDGAGNCRFYREAVI